MTSTILIVEDDRIIQNLIEWRLKGIGYPTCARASSGKDAIDYVEKNHPAVVLMDIKLDDTMDGIEAARIIRETAPSTHVIFLTGNVDDDIVVRARAIHPDGFIEKPFNDSDLRIALKLAFTDPEPVQASDTTEDLDLITGYAAPQQDMDEGLSNL